MVILLDSSASVPEDVFETTKKFASDLVKRFDTSKDRAHVAVLSYSQYVHTERRFDDDPSQESILKAIDGVNYEGSFSRLDSALDILHNKIFKKKHGARSSRNDVKKVVVVVTDGFSSLGIEFTKKLAGTLKRTGVNVFSVGTSGRVYKAELDELVSKPSEAHQLTRDLTKGAFTKDEVKRFAKEICGKKE
ncbi:hypothetical protein OS493_000160 [Desmophyllum pertusum]|uniref:VWFA domain-containing protein n=1 Tax=Desmophyllum pertusum TaxID=174260 RepID=A0A9X0A7R3_9CNID|nr:hypothetical protein OS493_000160 [Desmophyllum pertusum]